ncbi:hypothetical protein S40293_08909 [Stachybotrys chartarum IBT 40293]|nr:hypothetical protein S40293_08909 [Stachybotrys chartarum IBT 40293]
MSRRRGSVSSSSRCPPDAQDRERWAQVPTPASSSARAADPGSPSSDPPRRCQDGADLNGEDNADGRFTKRRRISRACDDCRRKKIKCDGKQPCSSCAEFNSVCTYQVPSRRNKAPALSHGDPKTVEARLHVAESVIRRFLPQVDLQTLESIALSPRPSSNRDDLRDDAGRSDQESPQANGTSLEGDMYIPLAENEDQLRYTDSGEFDFHGLSSGAAFLSRLTRHFPELMHYDSRIPFLPQTTRPNGSPAPLSAPSALFNGHSNYDYSRLPRRELARMLCEYSFNHASCLLRIVHVPSFYKRFDALYDLEESNYTQEQGRYVGLLYSILALGSMYDVDENDPSNPDHYKEAMIRGHKFYLGARLYLQDLTECRDMTSLQALLFIIQFLQAIGNLNSCYNLIGIALRSALRMGLHRHLPNLKMTPIDNEIRKRVFHTIRQMDIYLSTTLGLPVVLQARDIDQPLPIEVEDEYITEHALLQAPAGAPSMIQAFNAHDRLMEILATIVDFVYSPQSASRKATRGTYMIDVGQLRQVETKLHDWYQKLPKTLHPGQEQNIQLTRVQILLRFAYAHVQMMLYRPFMQFFDHQASSQDQRHQSFATAGITVCRDIIHIGLEIRKQNVLIGSYWFLLHTQFLAVLCLVFYISRNPDSRESAGILSDAVLGKSSIAGMAQRSLAADRLSAVLDSVFERVPQGLNTRIQTNSQASRGDSQRSSNARGVGNDYVNVRKPVPTAVPPIHEQQQWRLPTMPAPTVPNLGQMANTRSEQTTQTSPVATVSSTNTSIPSGGGPMAYPCAAGPLTEHATTSICDDTMQLIVPDFFGHFDGAAPQCLDQAEQGEQSMMNPASALFSLGGAGMLDESIMGIFDNLGTDKLWDMSRSPR